MDTEIGRRLQILEEKFEYQDQTIEALNNVIIDHQQQITKLEEKIVQLQTLLQRFQAENEYPNDKKPQRY
ncbi:SlyX family protein [Desulforhopalus singaporensis]|uniref:Zein-binding n=1 Tax=Desulforhopalus singaporensis TaxID=91360 RepID=A0A1H0LY20_9BACT|nr:SlyX family protein [Desulforhopalus singaporensis]SDO73098.1 Zein-binding [Desulforhopalus singaporensis]